MERIPFPPLDRSSLGGGLARMLDRFEAEGSLTGDLEADEFLRAHPAAALLGMLYEQRIRAEVAFIGPMRLAGRLGHLDMRRIAAMHPEELQAKFSERPAVHRFSNRMCDYTRRVAAVVTEKYDGDAARVWNDGVAFSTIRRRVQDLPGFGPGKSGKMKFVLHYLGYRDFSEDESG